MIGFKKNILIWVIVILCATNIATVATIYYHNYLYKINVLNTKTNHIEVPNNQLGRFFKEQLNLDEEKHQKFRTYRQKFHSQANILTNEMQAKRNEFLDELGKSNSDTVKLDQLASEIGYLHAKLKRITFVYYLEMKNICTDEQKVKLFEIFNAMANQEAEIKMPNKCIDNSKK